MKKFLKSIFITLCLSLVIISASAFLHINKSNTCYAVNDDNMHTVNFYSGNNLLYSVEVPDGFSLQQLQDSNILYNGDFSINTNGSDIYYGEGNGWVYTYNSWRIYNTGNIVNTINGENTIILNTTFENYVDGIELQKYLGKTITFSSELNYISSFNNGYILLQILGSSLSGSFYSNAYIRTINDIYSCSLTIPSDAQYIRFLYQNFTNETVTFSPSYAKVEYGTSASQFFSIYYINKMYNRFNSSNIDNVNWSLTSDTSTYDFSTPITQDINLYGYDGYYHNVKFFSDNNQLYNLKILDGQSLQDLENNNILTNDLFDNWTGNLESTSSYHIENDWYYRGIQNITGHNAYITTNSTSGLIFSRLSANYSSSIFNSDITLSVNVDDKINFFTISIPSSISSTGNFYEEKLNDINRSRLRIYYNASSNIFEFGIDLWDQQLHKLSCPQFLIGDYSDYFNVSYIDNLYREENNLNSNSNVLWSTSKSSGQFDFSQPIIEDTNIYGYEELEFNQNAEQLEAEASFQPSYYLLEKAINNIEYIHYKGQFKFNVQIDTSKLLTVSFLATVILAILSNVPV